MARATIPRLWLPVALAIVWASGACGPKRLDVVGPMPDAQAAAGALRERTSIRGPVRIDFRWQLNESGSRMSGVGVARIAPPYRARLDLFLDNDESVMSAALVDEELRLPYGASDDILPPVELMWGTLGVFRPMNAATLLGGARLEGEAERLRYAYENGAELHFEVGQEGVRGLELLDDGAVVEWVRLTREGNEPYPRAATYRNLVEFRELRITRTSVATAQLFDPAIWDPR